MVIDKGLLKRIARYADLKKEDLVLEVGCGTGNLTNVLLKNAGKVVGIEKDLKLAEFLKKRFKNEIESGKFELIVGDALKVEFPRFNKFVSNIPYKISSPLVFKLLKHDFELAVVMFQKEFADRLVREDNRLGVITKAYCKAEILEIVGPDSFRPKPKVHSALVKIVKEKQVEANLEIFDKLVTFAFSMKRKKMRKILEEFKNRFNIEISADDVAENRPEEIGAKKFAELSLRASRG
ncbi:MAG: 16S rRNA (adenine(1518)-N(6)/adenine(1519)-N(6))-dimethyltransferase RsmA [Archaeoglobaceae archaeon]|nr:16S rRNA (adenine(1518)-N(6)/adenine(1519)-N(6))-dimethyltransferase RsmA [Archaeoglobaceae archaeon]MCX8152273.1 16S rRNA (adenine(1518)-N(6)/adenine(1519)-N(6))-dimethyltransferase RsmA [Archaeoglobaceae archaeon]MDW8013951.1 16S rRNA (adenine(1518)-N(6)/adenine(1519)-N(6))-dimethyltransferase RsmA [Archaeoglobaceae archaeon]